MKINSEFLIWGAGAAIIILLVIGSVTDMTSSLRTGNLPVPDLLPAPENGEKASVSTVYSIPINSIPAYSEIEESIKKKEVKRALVKEIITARDKRIAMVNASSKIDPETDTTDTVEKSAPKDGAKIQARPSKMRRAVPTSEEIQDFKAKGYIVR